MVIASFASKNIGTGFILETASNDAAIVCLVQVVREATLFTGENQVSINKVIVGRALGNLGKAVRNTTVWSDVVVGTEVALVAGWIVISTVGNVASKSSVSKVVIELALLAFLEIRSVLSAIGNVSRR